MKILDEFKAFALKGNVVDMAVGIIIGGAFGKIVSSLVTDIIMPPIGLLIGGVDFAKLRLTIKEPVTDAAGKLSDGVYVNYGNFIQTTVDFVIIAFSIFLAVKIMNTLRRKETEPVVPPAPAPPSKEEVLLTQIRDLLQQQSDKINKN